MLSLTVDITFKQFANSSWLTVTLSHPSLDFILYIVNTLFNNSITIRLTYSQVKYD